MSIHLLPPSNLLVLYGPTRSGKTRFLNDFHNHTKQKCSFLDLQAERTHKKFTEQLRKVDTNIRFIQAVSEVDNSLKIRCKNLSGGEYSLLRFFSFIYTQPKRSIVLIDSIDTNLHPSIFKKLVSSLRSTIQLEKLSIICSVYSPYFLDHLDYTELLIFKEQKYDFIDSHPLYEKWKNEMSLGEMVDLFKM